ncbi:unnamed protein product [Prorocentrum cordatum]|uniref:Uncharacterized protein n=1 Tax=Prorocentrum cordatum TaxID=2364126 RepID=A0ABN9UTB3_9DINO|nr:unnamed protein product [Polarella glacialis]
MDEPSVGWAEERYEEIKKKISPFLKQSGYKDEQVLWLPISGLSGDNVKERKNIPAGYQGPTLMEMFDNLETPKRESDQPVRIPMLDGYRDMGAVTAIGKVEQGTVRPGMKCVLLPTGTKCTIASVFINNTEGEPEDMSHAPCGENVTMKVTGCSEDQLAKGYVLCPVAEPARVVTKFKAQLQVIELPEDRRAVRAQRALGALEAVCPPASLPPEDPGKACPPCPEAPPCPTVPAVCAVPEISPAEAEADPLGTLLAAVLELWMASLPRDAAQEWWRHLVPGQRLVVRYSDDPEVEERLLGIAQVALLEVMGPDDELVDWPPIKSATVGTTVDRSDSHFVPRIALGGLFAFDEVLRRVGALLPEDLPGYVARRRAEMGLSDFLTAEEAPLPSC